MGEPVHERAVMSAAGYVLESASCASEADVIAAVERTGASGLLVQYASISREVLEACPSVCVVGRYGVGLDTIDVDAAADRGVQVVNVPDYAATVVADHTLALLLALARELPRWTTRVAAGAWRPIEGAPPEELAGSVLGLIGFGHIARAVARRARGFGMNVLAHDPFVSDDVFEQEAVERVGRDELWSRSGAVSLHVPLSDETRGLVGAHALELLDDGLLVNTARAGLIDRDALERALDNGRLRGAGLDVWWDEPPLAGDPLLDHPRLLVTPHVAWFSGGSELRLRTQTAQRVAEALDQALGRSGGEARG